jgi:hypothetical protein
MNEYPKFLQLGHLAQAFPLCGRRLDPSDLHDIAFTVMLLFIELKVIQEIIFPKLGSFFRNGATGRLLYQLLFFAGPLMCGKVSPFTFPL